MGLVGIDLPTLKQFLKCQLINCLQVRAVLLAVDERDDAQRLLGSGSADYSHSCISQKLPSDIVDNGTLPPGYVLQHATDWINAARQALDKAIMKQHQAGNEVMNIVGPFFLFHSMPIE